VEKRNIAEIFCKFVALLGDKFGERKIYENFSRF